VHLRQAVRVVELVVTGQADDNFAGRDLTRPERLQRQ
jgi:hypothetical protein